MKRVALVLFLALIPQTAFSQSHEIDFGLNVYQKTAAKWVRALSKSSDISSTTYISKEHGGKDSLHPAKHRDSIVWIPKSTDLSKDFIMLVWFHGHIGYDEVRTFQDRTLLQLVPHAKRGKNFVLVLPEMPWSKNGRTPTKRNGMIWRKSGDFLQFIEQAKSILKSHNENKELGNIDYRVVGHSAGGSTIKAVSITQDLCKLNPSVVVWSDSSYGRWLDNAWSGCLKDSSAIIKVFVRKWGSPHRQAARFLKSFEKKPENIELHVMTGRWTHKLIGNNAVKLSNILGDENEANR